MNKALVTGATGFIGTQLCERLLSAGYQVRATVRDTSNQTRLIKLGVETVPCDLASECPTPQQFEGITHVFHLAGLTTSPNLEKLRSVNVTGTENLAKAIASLPNPPKVIHVSSIAASGPGKRDQVRSSNESPKPVSNYGRSKLEGEQAIAAIADRTSVSIVRPGLVFGPGDREGLRIAKPIARVGIHMTPGFRTPPLSVIYVHDLVDILMRTAKQGCKLPSAASADLKGRGIYIAAASEHPTYRKWGQMIGKALQRKMIAWPIFPNVARVVGLVAQAIGSGTLHYDKIREALVPSWAYFDPQLETDLGFQPSASITDQLADTIAWYRQEKML